MKQYTSSEAAKILGYSSAAAIRTLIMRTGLKLKKHGSAWAISDKDLKVLEQAVTPRRRKAS